MRFTLFALSFFLICNAASARQDDEGRSRKNATTVGFMIGPAAVSTELTNNVPTTSSYFIPKDVGPSFCMVFTAEQYFNRSHPKLYFSLGGRLGTTYLETPNYNNYYPLSTGGVLVTTNNTNNHMLIGSLGISAGLNWDIVRGKKAALTAQLAAVPMAEAGNFKNTYQPNAAGELYIGGTFMKKISIGLRGSYRFMSYEYDYTPYTGDRYRITHIAFDFRFRINGGNMQRTYRTRD